MLSRHRCEISTFCAGGRGRSDDIDPGIFCPVPFRMLLTDPSLLSWAKQYTVKRRWKGLFERFSAHSTAYSIRQHLFNFNLQFIGCFNFLRSFIIAKVFGLVDGLTCCGLTDYTMLCDVHLTSTTYLFISSLQTFTKRLVRAWKNFHPALA